MNDYPILRIEIEGVRKTLMHHLGSALQVEAAHIEREIKAQLAAIDMKALIHDVVRAHTKPMVEEAVRRAVSDVLWSSRGEIEAAVVRALSRKP